MCLYVRKGQNVKEWGQKERGTHELSASPEKGFMKFFNSNHFISLLPSSQRD